MLIILTILVFVLLLSVLVLIHEAGHFFTAKYFGIKVEEFGWGFPPRLFGIKRGETVYSINLLPIGGFVKLYGEDDAGGGQLKSPNTKSQIPKTDLKRAFFARPAWQRALVVFAGVVMNVVLAFVIFYVYLGINNFKTSLPLLSQYQFTNTHQQNYNLNPKDSVVSYVESDSPAASLGMNTPAKITQINGKPVKDRESLIKTVNNNKGKEISITWNELMTGHTKTGVVTPRKNPPKNQGSLGIAFVPISVISYNTPAQKILSGITFSFDQLVYTGKVLGQLIAVSVETRNAAPVSGAVSGPIGIGYGVFEVLQLPNTREVISTLLLLAGAMSLSLAFFNVLPIPALDGGRLFFIVIEMVTKRKVNPEFEAKAHTIGFALLMLLIIVIMFSDIWKFFL